MRCVVLGCTMDNHGKKYKKETFFRFPKDQNMCQAWKYACGLADDFSTTMARICQLHFDKSDFERIHDFFGNREKAFRRLKSYAIPTFNLPKLSGNVSHNIGTDIRNDKTERTYQRSTGEITTNTGIQKLGAIKPSQKRCAVAKCNTGGKVVFEFPNYQLNQQVYFKWLFYCKNSKLLTLAPEKVDTTYGFCATHFINGYLSLQGSTPALKHSGNKNAVIANIPDISQLCRLCLSVANVDLFSNMDDTKVLKDIVKVMIPIEINKNDVSILICESCKLEVLKFHTFLQKSMKIDQYFRAIKKRISNDEDNNDEVIIIEDSSNAEDVKFTPSNEGVSLAERISEGSDSDGAAVSLLRKRLTSEQTKLQGNDTSKHYAPLYVVEYFHTYGKRRKVDDKVGAKKILHFPKLKLMKVSKEDSDVQKNNTRKQDDTIICIHCSKVVPSIEDFHEHCRIENHNPIFACSDCNRMFKTQDELEDHSEGHKKIDICICDRCGKQFTKRDSLYTHLSTVHRRRELKFDCKECSKKFATSYRLKLHMRVHTNDRPYCCEKCGAVFTVLTNLKNHQVIHSDAKPYVCLICNKGFRRRYKLHVHLTTHTDERKYSCEVCGISYKRKLNLNRHNNKHHANPKEKVEEHPRTCPHCNFVCNFAAQMKLHMLKEHKSYTCIICNMSFKSYQPYYHHKFKHYPHKKKYGCSYCNKRFINATLLKVHMVVHTGKKNFECGLCKKRFSQRPHLQSHLLTHTGEKPYKCKYCDRSFAHLSTLVVHERIHTGETPYVCQFCEKGFGHLTNYKKHVFSQHGVVMPKVRDYSSVQKVEEIEEEDYVADEPDIIAELPKIEYINEDALFAQETVEIISDPDTVFEIAANVG